MLRARHVVNIDHVDNDREDITIAQFRNERRKRRIITPSPQPMEAEVQDEVEFEGDYGQNQEQESHCRVSYTDSALDKIGQAMQTLANLLAEREKDKNASSTSHTVYGVKVPLSEFLKLAPPIFKEVDNSEDP